MLQGWGTSGATNLTDALAHFHPGPDNIAMSKPSSLKNHFLIALPGLEDPNFSRTVTYVCEHSENGAMGIVLNHPSELHLIDVLNHMEIKPSVPGLSSQPVYLGGPVEGERGFVLHSPASRWDSSMCITDDICVTTSRDILQAMAQGQGPDKTLVALGYAGWGAGQLEQELQSDTWLSGPADPGIIFDLPAELRLTSAAALLGVDLNLITSTAGHA